MLNQEGLYLEIIQKFRGGDNVHLHDKANDKDGNRHPSDVADNITRHILDDSGNCSSNN